MRAVNLIPRDTASGATGGSSTTTYAVLAMLALIVVMSALYTVSGRAVATKRAEVAQATAQVTAAEATAARLKTYTELSDLRKARVETVRNLADSRFDWAGSLHEVARTLPRGTWLTSLRATVTPNASVDGTSDPLRTAIAAPALELMGCAPSQEAVAGVLTSLRQISGVRRVTLSASKRPETSGAGAGDSAAASDGCGKRPQFSITVFYEAGAASAATTSTAPAQASTASATPATTAATSGDTP
jgi:Tfp pilus assembly protein PilN